MIAKTLAGLNCPSCEELQSPHTLMQTHTLRFKRIESHACKSCAAKLRVVNQRFFLRICIGVCLVVPAFLLVFILLNFVFSALANFELPSWIQDVTQFGFFVFISTEIIGPISARILKVEEVI